MTLAPKIRRLPGFSTFGPGFLAKDLYCVTLLGKYVKQKKVGWEIIFSELGFAGSGARKPQQEFEGSALARIFYVVLRLNWALITIV